MLKNILETLYPLAGESTDGQMVIAAGPYISGPDSPKKVTGPYITGKPKKSTD